MGHIATVGANVTAENTAVLLCYPVNDVIPECYLEDISANHKLKVIQQSNTSVLFKCQVRKDKETVRN